MVQVLNVFKPETGKHPVDKTRPFDITNMIPCKHDSPALLDKQLALYKDDVCDIGIFITYALARCFPHHSVEE